MICKKCKVESTGTVAVGDKIVYTAPDGKKWQGRLCPTCNALRSKEWKRVATGYREEYSKACKFCNNIFTTQERKTSFCGDKCKNKFYRQIPLSFV